MRRACACAHISAPPLSHPLLFPPDIIHFTHNGSLVAHKKINVSALFCHRASPQCLRSSEWTEVQTHIFLLPRSPVPTVQSAPSPSSMTSVPTTSNTVALNPDAPHTSIQVRLADGTRCVCFLDLKNRGFTGFKF